MMCGAHDPSRSSDRAPPRHQLRNCRPLLDGERVARLGDGQFGRRVRRRHRDGVGTGLTGSGVDGADLDAVLGSLAGVRERSPVGVPEDLARVTLGEVDGDTVFHRGRLVRQRLVEVVELPELHERRRRLRRVALVARRLVARDVRALVVLRRVVSALGQGVRLRRCLGERVRPHLGLDLDDGLAVELQGEVARRLGLGLGEQLDEHAATRRTTSDSVGSGHAAALAVGVARVGVAPRLGVSGHLLVGLGDSFDVPLELLDELHLAANGVLRRLALRNTDLDLVVADRVTDGAVDPAEALPLGVALPVPAGRALRVVACPERHRPVGLEAVVLLALRCTVRPDAGEDGHLGAQLDAVDGRGAGAARRLRVALAADDVGALASAGTDLHVVTGRRLLVGAADTAGRC